jgi:hypothetical protein
MARTKQPNVRPDGLPAEAEVIDKEDVDPDGLLTENQEQALAKKWMRLSEGLMYARIAHYASIGVESFWANKTGDREEMEDEKQTVKKNVEAANIEYQSAIRAWKTAAYNAQAKVREERAKKSRSRTVPAKRKREEDNQVESESESKS